jgi:hypothetical protein
MWPRARARKIDVSDVGGRAAEKEKQKMTTLDEKNPKTKKKKKKKKTRKVCAID